MASGRSQWVSNIREEDDGEDVSYPPSASTAAAVELFPDGNIEVPHIEEHEEEGGHVEDLRQKRTNQQVMDKDQSVGDRG